MLDAETKRRIDNARDILVGKVPDPKTQVEQITFAMIYKFMDDMDQQSVGIGGEPSFFTNGYEKFAWSKLMDKRLGGEARLDLYVQALDQMSQNPHIPQLFRDIFKGAFLPYRDSETLNLFLKEMNSFNYTHSEDLGDAYEYLLSIFASQGKAGQFRTPRHIIDFIVDCVNPSKDDTMLDPACGTAGFLISAYKHILEAHVQNPLSPDEKKRLTENFVGYDISPDMVRLSRVNMYLHQFPNPTIHEYDTLTTEDRWDDNFDVILANPPFMTPKGGIRPHNRFAVRANRSEVLFVDYIAEHLNQGGRAGVVVPEGIIFQSSNAYKALRKMLVDDYLTAVISLPSGVFQPYTGVKTTIIIFDRTLAKLRKQILFSQITNIGLSLGAKREVIAENDLPNALSDYQNYSTGVDLQSNASWLVDKKEIVDNDYLLTGERYRPVNVVSGTKRVRLGDVCRITKGSFSSTKTVPGKFPLIVTAEKFLSASDYQFEEDAVCVPLISSKGHGKADISRIHYGNGKFALANLLAALQATNKDILDLKFLYHILDAQKPKLANLMKGAAHVGMNIQDLANFKIPLPPIEIQREIVEELEGYQKVIDGARQVVENYKPTIPIDPSWPKIKLGDEELFLIESGGTPRTDKPEYWDGDVPWVTLIDLPQENLITYIYETKRKITEKGLVHSSAKMLPINTVLVSSRATIGRIALTKIELATNQGFKNIIVKDKSRILEKYLALVLTAQVDRMIALGSGGTYKEISKKTISSLEIPLPSIEYQNNIINEIEGTLELVDANKQLLRRMEQKIQDRIQRVWSAS